MSESKYTNPRFVEDGASVKLYGVSATDNSTPIAIVIDEDSGSVITTTHAINMVHQGYVWNTGHYFTNVADNAAAELLIKNSAAEELHGEIAISVGGNSIFELFEGPTVGANGTSLPIGNHNRQIILNSPAPTTGVTAFHTPTHNSPQTYGTQIHPGALLAGGTGPKAAGGGGGTPGEQWIFAKSTDYIIKVTNISGGAVDISIDYVYHGHA